MGLTFFSNSKGSWYNLCRQHFGGTRDDQ